MRKKKQRKRLHNAINATLAGSLQREGSLTGAERVNAGGLTTWYT